MHKRVYLLSKSDSRDEALLSVNNFLDDHHWSAYDWYAIGGRWTNVLAPEPELSEFYKAADEILEIKKDSNGTVPHTTVEKNKDKLQEKWKDLGLSDLNPYCNHYKIPSEGQQYDCIPLSDCIEKVKLAQQTEESIKHTWEDKANDEYKDQVSMRGYVLEIAGQLYQQKFGFECNIYNINKCNYSIPEDPKGWYTTVIDLHN